MNRCLIILTTFAIFSGCFCEANLKKQFVSTHAYVTNNSTQSATANIENATNFRIIANKSLEITETSTTHPIHDIINISEIVVTGPTENATNFGIFSNKSLEIVETQLKNSNKDEIDPLEIVVMVPADEEEKIMFSKLEFNILAKIRQLFVSFMDKVEEEKMYLNESDNKLTKPKVKRQGIDDFFKKAKEAVVETQKTVEASINVVKTIEDHAKKLATRNVSFDNSTQDDFLSHSAASRQDGKDGNQDDSTTAALSRSTASRQDSNEENSNNSTITVLSHSTDPHQHGKDGNQDDSTTAVLSDSTASHEDGKDGSQDDSTTAVLSHSTANHEDGKEESQDDSTTAVPSHSTVNHQLSKDGNQDDFTTAVPSHSPASLEDSKDGNKDDSTTIVHSHSTTSHQHSTEENPDGSTIAVLSHSTANDQDVKDGNQEDSTTVVPSHSTASHEDGKDGSQSNFTTAVLPHSAANHRHGKGGVRDNTASNKHVKDGIQEDLTTKVPSRSRASLQDGVQDNTGVARNTTLESHDDESSTTKISKLATILYNDKMNSSTKTTKIVPKLGKPAVEKENVVTSKHGNNNNKITPDFGNHDVLYSKIIDENTEIVFTEEQIVTNVHHVPKKNVTMKKRAATVPGKGENNYNTIKIKHSKKCKGHVNGSQCNMDSYPIPTKQQNTNENNSLEANLNKGRGTLQTIPENEELQIVSVDSKTSYKDTTGVNTVKTDYFLDKNWLWQHLHAVKNNSLKSNLTETFSNAHHFLLNSGGTEKSATATFESIETDSMIDLNKLILEKENVHQIPNVEKELPLKRHRRIKRYANKKQKRNLLESEEGDDEVVILPDEEDPTTSRNIETTREEFTTPTIEIDMSTSSTAQTPSPAASESNLTPSFPSKSATITREQQSSLSTETEQHDKTETTLKHSTNQPEEFEVFKGTVPKMKKVVLTDAGSINRSYAEREWNDAEGIRTKPLILIVTVPSFIGMGLFIIALCFLTRNGGWCCRLFNPRSASQASRETPRDIQQPTATKRPKSYQ